MVFVGLDLGSFSVKVAELHVLGKTVSFSHFEEHLLSSDPNKDKKIETLDILRRLAGRYDPENTKFIFSVPQSLVSLRQKVFPFRERFKIMRAIAFEVEDDIPFSQDEAVFEAKITQFQQAQSTVLACAVQKSTVKDILGLARDAGMECHILSIEGIALANFVEAWDLPPRELPQLVETPEPQPAELLVNIGHSRTVIAVFQNGSLLLTRSIDFGGKNIAESIAQNYDMLYLEGLRELQKKGFVLVSNEGATPDQIRFSDLIKRTFEPLVNDLKLTMLELAARQPIRFTSMKITGGVSQLQNLAPFLTQALDIQVNRLRYFENHPWTRLELNSHSSAVASMAWAMAVEGLRRPRNPAVNLMRGEFERRSQTFDLFWARWSYAAKLGGITIGLFLLFGIVRETLATRANEIIDQVLKEHAVKVAGLRGQAASARNIRRFVKGKKAEMVNRKAAEESKKINSALDILRRLSEASPARSSLNVVLRRLKISNEQVEVQGDLPNGASIDSLKKVLEGLAVDGKISPTNTTQSPVSGRKSFAFQFQTERK